MTLDNAWKNVRVFRREVQKQLRRRLEIVRVRGRDVADYGWPKSYAFDIRRSYGLTRAGNPRWFKMRVDMPGCSLSELTTGRAGAPRLYVDGNSWWWKYGIVIVVDAFKERER